MPVDTFGPEISLTRMGSGILAGHLCPSGGTLTASKLPMTDAQQRLLKKLCKLHGVEFDPSWDRTYAKCKITQLIHKEKRAGGTPDMAA